MIRILFIVVLLLQGILQCIAQSVSGIELRAPVALSDTDSTFILRHFLRNDIRVFYGYQANSLIYGSVNDSDPNLSGDLYENFNDFIGVGITYKWIDGNLTFSLPGTAYLNQERSNLDQFTLGLNATGRQLAFRGFIRNTKGMVAETPDPEFKSLPTLHELKIVAQFTYIFNAEKYSYRAALYQSELQKRTVGSWMLRIEPFYRELGARQAIIQAPYDNVSRFGEQTGLQYIGAPGIVVKPGYGINISWKQGKYFLSPMIFGGTGVAFNRYTSDSGTHYKTNMEWSGNILLNAGYNGSRTYCRVQSSVSIGYTKIDPAYLMTKDFEIELLVGYRFSDLENRIPRTFKKE